MTKAFIADVLRENIELTNAGATLVAGNLIDAIVKRLKDNGKFMLPNVGTLTVHSTKARTWRNPKTQEPIKVKAGKTVRFKASPGLKKTMAASRKQRGRRQASA